MDGVSWMGWRAINSGAGRANPWMVGTPRTAHSAALAFLCTHSPSSMHDTSTITLNLSSRDDFDDTAGSAAAAPVASAVVGGAAEPRSELLARSLCWLVRFALDRGALLHLSTCDAFGGQDMGSA